MESLLGVYLLLGGLVWAYMTLWFLAAIRLRRNDLADIAWGPGFLLIGLAALWQGGIFSVRGWLVVGLVAAWALRLAVHVYRRNRGKAEDYRYERWRQQWGRWFYPRTYLQVFLLQGLLMLVIALPAVLVNVRQGPSLGWLDVLGLLIWLGGFIFETISDRQLAVFLADRKNRGRIMQSGLWRYSRHPNYFGEVAQWWGIWLITLSVAYGWLGILSPLLITVLIWRVSGIPLLEKKMADKPGFAEYKKKTSIFFPWPPRK